MSERAANDSQKIAQDLASLQKMLLPQAFPEMPGYEIAIHYRPCEAAGGDFYGWGDRGEGVFGMGVADVAGHGLRAAVVMAMLRTWLAAFQHFNRPMATMANDLNSFFTELGGLNTFVTIILMKLETRTGKFSIRNCGHPSPRLRRCDGTVITLNEGRMLPLGIGFDEDEVPEADGTLEPGEALVFYTDGITESVSEDGSFFDEERLDAAIAGSENSAQAIVDCITQSMLWHRGSHVQRDDECILVIRRG